MELGPEDVSLLERCPHFRGWMYRLQFGRHAFLVCLQAKKSRPKASSQHSEQLQQSDGKVGGGLVRGESVEGAGGGGGSSEGGSRSSKKRKKKMQKVNPAAMLGFTVNAGERPNIGEIQSAKDAV